MSNSFDAWRWGQLTARHLLEDLNDTLALVALAEAVDVSPWSLRRHMDALTALDLARETDDGVRLALPFSTDEERGRRILPEPLTTDRRVTAE